MKKSSNHHGMQCLLSTQLPSQDIRRNAKTQKKNNMKKQCINFSVVRKKYIKKPLFVTSQILQKNDKSFH